MLSIRNLHKDEIRYISTFLNYLEIYNWRQTCRYMNQSKMFKTFTQIVHERLTALMPDVNGFLNNLIQFNCGITGSFLLQCIFGFQWPESDIDVVSCNRTSHSLYNNAGRYWANKYLSVIESNHEPEDDSSNCLRVYDKTSNILQSRKFKIGPFVTVPDVSQKWYPIISENRDYQLVFYGPLKPLPQTHEEYKSYFLNGPDTHIPQIKAIQEYNKTCAGGKYFTTINLVDLNYHSLGQFYNIPLEETDIFTQNDMSYVRNQRTDPYLKILNSTDGPIDSIKCIKTFISKSFDFDFCKLLYNPKTQRLSIFNMESLQTKSSAYDLHDPKIGVVMESYYANPTAKEIQTKMLHARKRRIEKYTERGFILKPLV